MHFCCRAPYGARGLKCFNFCVMFGYFASRAPYGARGLKSTSATDSATGRKNCRAPYGARGLKCETHRIRHTRKLSRPVWGAWIEIGRGYPSKISMLRRAPYGARGLKYFAHKRRQRVERRAPYGARGLKWRQRERHGARLAVAPRMGRVD